MVHKLFLRRPCIFADIRPPENKENRVKLSCGAFCLMHSQAEILVKMDKLHDASGVVSWVLEQKPFDVKAAQHLANIYGLSQQHKQV